MLHARDLMRPATVIGPSATVQELAELLLDTGADGACVLDGEMLIGVVTSMDCIFRGKRVRPPAVFVLFDIVIPLEGPERLRKELRRLAAATVGGLMTREVVSVSPNTPVDDLATKMVEQHLTVLPVLDGTRLLGMVTKRDLLKLVADPSHH